MPRNEPLWMKILEWTATIVLLCGIALTSFNVYPINLFISATGNFLWLLLGVAWKRNSLLISQGVIICLYAVGIYKYFFLTT